MNTKQLNITVTNLTEESYTIIMQDLNMTAKVYPDLHIVVENVYEDDSTLHQEIEDPSTAVVETDE